MHNKKAFCAKRRERMKKRNSLLASLLISTQLLGVATPVMAQNAPAIDTPWAVRGKEDEINYSDGLTKHYKGSAITPTDIENTSKYLRNNTYSPELRQQLDNLLGRAKNVNTFNELDGLIDDFTGLWKYIDTEDAGHNMADAELLGMGDAYHVHELIRNEIYLLGEGGKSRLIRYANQLAMGLPEGSTGFVNQIGDLFNTHQIAGADAEMYRINTLTGLFYNARQEGENIEFELVGGRLIYRPYEELGIEVEPPYEKPEPEKKNDSERELKIDGMTGDPDEYGRGELSDRNTTLRDKSGSYYEYDAVNGRRILVTYTIKNVNGKDERQETRTVEATGLTSMWSDKFGSMFGGGSYMTERHDKENKKEESRLTLQYTLNKDSEFPSYIDTGLFVDLNGDTSYQSLYDVLFQIAVNIEDGFLVEDSDKLLIVVEGKPIYIAETKEIYTKKEVESIFKGFEKVDLIISETRIGTTNSLEWQLKTGQAQKVVIDSQEFEMKNDPSIRGDRVVLPIVEIMKAVGADVNESEDLITVSYKQHVVTFEIGVSEARINGELYDLTVPVEVDDRGTHTANLMPIFKQLGIEAVWDEEASTLFLDNTLRDVEDIEEIKVDNKKETKEDKEN